MNRAKTMGMTEEDRMISKAFFMFMMTPLVTLVLVGAALAMTS